MSDVLMNLFGISTMSGNYEERAVARDEKEDFTLDTVLVTDRLWTYETAVQHKDFNDNDWIILDGCNDKEEALVIHNKWLEFLKKDDFSCLTDYCTDEDFVREV